MIEVTQNQNVAADHNMSDPAVFTPSALSAVVHDKTLPDETRRKAARLLIPHLQIELARLRGRAVSLSAAPLRGRRTSPSRSKRPVTTGFRRVSRSGPPPENAVAGLLTQSFGS